MQRIIKGDQLVTDNWHLLPKDVAFEDVPNSDDVIQEINPQDLAELMPSLDSGMVPKMQACYDAVTGGVPRATVVDGREPHAVLLELFTKEGVGTQVLPGVETKTRKARDAQ